MHGANGATAIAVLTVFIGPLSTDFWLVHARCICHLSEISLGDTGLPGLAQPPKYTHMAACAWPATLLHGLTGLYLP